MDPYHVLLFQFLILLTHCESYTVPEGSPLNTVITDLANDFACTKYNLKVSDCFFSFFSDLMQWYILSLTP